MKNLYQVHGTLTISKCLDRVKLFEVLYREIGFFNPSGSTIDRMIDDIENNESFVWEYCLSSKEEVDLLLKDCAEYSFKENQDFLDAINFYNASDENKRFVKTLLKLSQKVPYFLDF